MLPKKRPLAKRSCLRCREKKARCELPDIYVDSTKTPLPSDKQCHRCSVLGIDCIVWDGDRKRKPKLDPQGDPASGTSAERAEPSGSSSNVVRASLRGAEASADHHQVHDGVNKQGNVGLRRHRQNSKSNSDSSQTEQLAAAEIDHAQHLLLSRPKVWKALSRTLHALIDRLQHERKYIKYLQLRIDAPPSTPDLMSFLPLDRTRQLDLQLQDYLVGHPYLPTLSALHEEQAEGATRPRALLIATMTLLGLKGLEDELTSSDVRTLSSYIDRLGTQLLLSTPRDIHLVMAFELLLAHEPGLVGTGASHFEPEGRGFGLASENLFTCAVKIARELRLDEALTQTGGEPRTRLANISLWCCLRTWEGVYAFLGEKIAAPQDLNIQFASTIRKELYCIDDSGRPLPSAPRLQDAGGPTAQSFNEMRDFCSSLETQLGRDGILRSAGRSVLSLRLESTCILFNCLRELQEATSSASLPLEEKWARISAISRTAHDDIMMVRHRSKEDLGVYAGQRLVRVWEQLIHAECCFSDLLYASYATSALFSGKMDGALEATQLVRTVCQRLGPSKHIGEVGLRGTEVCRTLLATIQQMDRQPSRRRQSISRQETSFRYLHRLPTLLVCAMTVYAARRSLETIAFGLVAFANSPPESLLAVTLMEAAAQAVRRFSPACSIRSVDTVAQVSADYIEEMVETAHLWDIYYRVYRPVPSIRMNLGSHSSGASKDADQDHRDKAAFGATSAPQPTSAMDFLAEAATARSQASSNPLNSDGAIGVGPLISPHASTDTRSASASTQSLDAPWSGGGTDPPSSHMTAATTPMASSAGLLDASIFDASMPFDLEAFLRDVDQLF